MQLTTLTQFGARLSLAKLHIVKLLKACEDAIKVNHIFYLVDPKNKLLKNYLVDVTSQYSNCILLSRDDNNYTDFNRLKKAAPYGGDCNYDYLIRRPEVGDLFLTLHDDSIISTQDLYSSIVKLMENVDFAGYVDTRKEIDGYRDILIDGRSISEIRLGTWFTCGRKSLYLKNDYRIGDYRNYWKYFLWFRYGFNKRVVFKRQKVWLNGGFDLNIRARLCNNIFRILDDGELAYHLTKITGFFASPKRSLLQYADTSQEVDRWKDYCFKLVKREQWEQLTHDCKFMMELTNQFESEGIHDPLLNTRVVKELFSYE